MTPSALSCRSVATGRSICGPRAEVDVVALPLAGEQGVQGVISCDNVMTVSASDVLRLVGFLTAGQERELRAALFTAFDV